MGFRRLNIAVDCANEAEKQAVQDVLDELSNILRIKGEWVIKSAPLLKKHQSIIYRSVKTIGSTEAKWHEKTAAAISLLSLIKK